MRYCNAFAELESWEGPVLVPTNAAAALLEIDNKLTTVGSETTDRKMMKNGKTHASKKRFCKSTKRNRTSVSQLFVNKECVRSGTTVGLL
jgi:hypothetical protein